MADVGHELQCCYLLALRAVFGAQLELPGSRALCWGCHVEPAAARWRRPAAHSVAFVPRQAAARLEELAQRLEATERRLEAAEEEVRQLRGELHKRRWD